MTILYHPRPERWPQFTLRGLLIAVTVSAMLLPWVMAEYRAWQARRDSQPIGIWGIDGDDLVPTVPGSF